MRRRGNADTAQDAFTAGSQLYEDGLFSIQRVTEEIGDLGFYSMPCIWGQHNGSHLFCAVVITPPNLGVVPAAPNAVLALIDTGASTTAITTALAAQLNLQPIGKMPVHGVGGVHELEQ